MGGFLLARLHMQALSNPNTSPVKRAASASFRQRCASALMHTATLVALAVLLVNDLLFKALWPGAWVPGKLSDLAWMMFAPPVLAFVLSFATLGSLRAQRAAFAAAYAGLPLLYVAFNTFQPVHDVVLHVLGFVGGDGPRSPLDPTDSIVIPLAMAAAIWVWRQPSLETQSIRARLVLLATVAAVLASVASSYAGNWGIEQVGKTASGTLGANIGGFYESMDGGLTWTKAGEDFVPLERQKWIELELKNPSGPVFMLDSPYIKGEGRELVRGEVSGSILILDSPHIIREWTELGVEKPPRVFFGEDGRVTTYGISGFRDVVYSYKYLQSGGNRWMQALDNRDVHSRAIATEPLDLFYDDQTGNLILAMGLQGVVVVTPDGTSTQVAVGRYSPTDFSFWSKTRTFFSSLLHREVVKSTGLAFLLAFSFAALALVPSAASAGPRIFVALAAAISAFLAITVGVYPHAIGDALEALSGWRVIGGYVHLISGYGLFPLVMAVGGLAFAGISRRHLLAIAAASIGMLLLIGVGAVVLFETGPFLANFVAVGLVGLAAIGLWGYQESTREGIPEFWDLESD